MDVLREISYLLRGTGLNEEDMFILAIFLIMAIFYLTLFVTSAVLFILQAIAVYIMAFKAGYDKPWLAFIPIAQNYVVSILPSKQFSYLGLFKSYERGKTYWIMWAAVSLAPFVLSMLLAGLSVVPLVGYLASMFASLLTGVIRIARRIFFAILNIDLFEMYKLEQSVSIILGILSILVPVSKPIIYLVLCKKEPEYGYDNFYNPIERMVEE